MELGWSRLLSDSGGELGSSKSRGHGNCHSCYIGKLPRNDQVEVASGRLELPTLQIVPKIQQRGLCGVAVTVEISHAA